MFRKVLFWLHLSAGLAAGFFIFTMAATGVLLSFERQIVEFVDRDVRLVTPPNDAHSLPLNQLLDGVRHAGLGDPTAIVVSNQLQMATQFAIGRGKTVYVDPYSGAVLGSSSAKAHEFFFAVERVHRSLGAPLGHKNLGRWLTGIANLLFSVLILLGIVLWIPRRWNGKALRAVIAFRGGLRAKAREWNWHNVIGIWCAVPLLVISLSGMVMSFEWANVLLFRLAGETPPAFGRGGDRRSPEHGGRAPFLDPNYQELLAHVKTLQPDWHTITLNVARDAHAPLSVTIQTGAGGQPQYRTQYTLARESGTVIKTSSFSDGSLGQRWRGFVRFGHTGEYYGWFGQVVAGLASFGACVLVYSGVALSIRRLAAYRRRKNTADVKAKDSEPALQSIH
jgi:uncharacterized iron-regulated membrane protein